MKEILRLRARNAIWKPWQLKVLAFILLDITTIRNGPSQCIYIKDLVGNSGKQFSMTTVCTLFPGKTIILPNCDVKTMGDLLRSTPTSTRIVFVDMINSTKPLISMVIDHFTTGVVHPLNSQNNFEKLIY